MTAGTKPLTKRPAWLALETHHEAIGGLHLRQLFADDSTRGERLTADAAGIYLDYSKNRGEDQRLGGTRRPARRATRPARGINPPRR